MVLKGITSGYRLIVKSLNDLETIGPEIRPDCRLLPLVTVLVDAPISGWSRLGGQVNAYRPHKTMTSDSLSLGGIAIGGRSRAFFLNIHVFFTFQGYS